LPLVSACHHLYNSIVIPILSAHDQIPLYWEGKSWAPEKDFCAMPENYLWSALVSLAAGTNMVRHSIAIHCYCWPTDSTDIFAFSRS